MLKKGDVKLGGTAVAVMIGFSAIIYSVFSKETLGTKLIIFLLGCLFAWLGLNYSKT